MAREWDYLIFVGGIIGALIAEFGTRHGAIGFAEDIFALSVTLGIMSVGRWAIGRFNKA